MDFNEYPSKRSISTDGFFSADRRPRRGAIDPTQKLSKNEEKSLHDVLLTSSPTTAGSQSLLNKNLVTARALPKPPEETNVLPKLKKSKTDKEPKLHNWKRILKRTVALIVLAFILTGGYVGFNFYRNIAKITHDNNPLSLLSILRPVALRNQAGHVNILVAGDSVGDPGHQGAALADSIMVLSLNTNNHTAFLLSIPRDTWVDIPSLGHQKINAANDVSNFNQSGYPAGGMGQLEQIVSQDFGIKSDYYALINYTAFKDAVNAVGGITININSPDSRGLYDPYTGLRLSNGQDTLNGQQALNLARSRGDGPGSYGFPASDFDRTGHQREMAIAVEQKATSIGFISNPIKVGQFLNAIGSNVQTNLKLDEIETLYRDTKGLNNNNIQSFNLASINGHTLLTGYLAPDGEDALIPTVGVDNFSQIQTAIAGLLSSSP
jgi:LCP family protein required for cell wall assembly